MGGPVSAPAPAPAPAPYGGMGGPVSAPAPAPAYGGMGGPVSAPAPFGGGPVSSPFGGPANGSFDAGSAATAAFGAGASAFGLSQGNAAMGEAMAGMVANQVGDQVNSVLVKWFPQYVGGLREYFNVTHAYVGKKLAFHLVPPAVALRTDGYEFNADSGAKVRQLSQPDLYIPLMSYITYVILVGLLKGISGQDFHPEYLHTCATFAMVFGVLEWLGARIAFYISGYALGGLDLVSLLGCKFVHLVIQSALALALPRMLQYVTFALLSASAAFGLLQMLRVLPHHHSHGPLVNGCMIGYAIAQVPLFWIL